MTEQSNVAPWLIVMDDEPDICTFIKDVAESIGFEVAVPRSAAEFRTLCRQLDPALIMLDLQMPDTDGIELLRVLANDKVSATIVLASGADRKILETARRLGQSKGLAVTHILQKPIPVEALLPILREGLERQPRVTASEIARALKEQELQLYYQPKIDLTRKKNQVILGVEALARWEHPRHGLIMPADFIPIAERTDLIISLTDYVVDSALRRFKSWCASGYDIPVAINLPAQFFADSELPDRLHALAREHGVAPERVTLEVTESSAMADVTQAMEVFTRLRLKGFRLAIDDFGTGYSSLSQLHRMPFSELKIDKEFVQDLATNRDSFSIVKSVVTLSKGLELTVCAEGIEDAAALDLLRDLGCDCGQGYYFSKALRSNDLLALMGSRRGAFNPGPSERADANSRSGAGRQSTLRPGEGHSRQSREGRPARSAHDLAY